MKTRSKAIGEKMQEKKYLEEIKNLKEELLASSNENKELRAKLIVLSNENNDLKSQIDQKPETKTLASQTDGQVKVFDKDPPEDVGGEFTTQTPGGILKFNQVGASGSVLSQAGFFYSKSATMVFYQGIL